MKDDKMMVNYQIIHVVESTRNRLIKFNNLSPNTDSVLLHSLYDLEFIIVLQLKGVKQILHVRTGENIFSRFYLQIVRNWTSISRNIHSGPSWRNVWIFYPNLQSKLPDIRQLVVQDLNKGENGSGCESVVLETITNLSLVPEDTLMCSVISQMVEHLLIFKIICEKIMLNFRQS